MKNGLSSFANTIACSGANSNGGWSGRTSNSQKPRFVRTIRGIAFGDACLGGELCAGHRPGPVHCLVETKAYPDPHQRYADRSAEIAYHLSHELLKFLFVNDAVSP